MLPIITPAYASLAVTSILLIIALFRVISLSLRVKNISLSQSLRRAWRTYVCCARQGVNEFTGLINQKPQINRDFLRRKLVFHVALSLALLLYACSSLYIALLKPEQVGEPFPWPPLAAHIITYPLAFLCYLIVLDMWLTVVDFEPTRYMLPWRLFCVLLFLPALVLSALVVIPSVVQATSLGIEANAVSLILTIYNAVVYMILALLFFVAGCMIQHRIVNVFNESSLWWGKAAALFRINLVIGLCSFSFLVKAFQLLYLFHRRMDVALEYSELYLSCSQKEIEVGRGNTKGLLHSQAWGCWACYEYLSWTVYIIPAIALTYLMRKYGDPSSRWNGAEGQGLRNESSYTVSLSRSSNGYAMIGAVDELHEIRIKPQRA